MHYAMIMLASAYLLFFGSIYNKLPSLTLAEPSFCLKMKVNGKYLGFHNANQANNLTIGA